MNKSALILIFFTFLLYSNSDAQRATFGDGVPKPLKRVVEFNKQRFSGGLDIRHARLKAIHQSDKISLLNAKNPNFLLAQQPEWQPIGPTRVGGRIRSIAIDPQNGNIIYIGAAAGGIWKSTDKGSSWNAIFDNENAISFGALAIDPNNSDIIYAGSGEMIIGGGSPYLGSGLYKSNDAGTIWDLVGLSEAGAFSKIYVDPKNSNMIFAGAAESAGGFYYSADAGNSWNKIYSGDITDISINLQNSKEIFIGVNADGIYYTSDLGKNWEKRSNIQNIGGRISVQAYSNNFDLVYTLIERTNTKGAIYKSENKGKTWTLSFDGDYSFFREQGFYDNFIQIHPSNSDIILAGGIKLWKSSNGGKSWNSVSENSAEGDIHVDQHCAAFNPSNPKEVYAGNDGGIFSSTDAGNTWKNINNNLEITQFYALAIDFTQNNRNYGGTQDNGTIGGSSTNNWKQIGGGDGFDTFVHPFNNKIIFGELYYGIPWLYLENGINSELTYLDENLPKNDSGLWHSPFIIDPNSETLYLGLHAVYSSINYGDVWFPITDRFPVQITSIATSEIKSNYIWAGNESGDLIFSTNYGASWRDVNGKNMPGRYITDIKTSYTNVNIAYVSFSGYGTPKLFRTDDSGLSWTDVSINLPDVPVNSIAINPLNEKNILVGTDVGVFASYNEGKDWFPFGRGLPRSPVLDLIFHKNLIKAPGITLRAATHGRSVWELVVPTEAIQNVEITSPAGGEVLFETSNFKLSWYGFSNPVNVEYSLNDGNDWIVLATNVTSNNLLWKIPRSPALKARVKISSVVDGTSLISRTFTIMKIELGAPLQVASLSFTPYGICSDGKGNLWATDYYSNQVRLLEGNTLSVIKSINIPGLDLFTDITYDKMRGILYIHRLNSSDGDGAVIVATDTLGNLIDEIISPAKSYPIGLAFDGIYLFVSERDANRMIYKINPDSPDNIISTFNNPRQVQYGPRCMTFANSELHQISTNYSSSVLNDAKIVVFDAILNSEVKKEIPATYLNTINARGVELDEKDGNYWVTDFDGNIYKIAGNTTPSSTEQSNHIEGLEIMPNPAHNFINIVLPNENGVIYIYDVFGNLLSELKQKSNRLLNVAINSWASGTYFVKFISNKNEIKYCKFVKVN